MGNGALFKHLHLHDRCRLGLSLGGSVVADAFGAACDEQNDSSLFIIAHLMPSLPLCPIAQTADAVALLVHRTHPDAGAVDAK